VPDRFRKRDAAYKPVSDIGDGFRVPSVPIAMALKERQRAKKLLRKPLEALENMTQKEREPSDLRCPLWGVKRT
jgi:hypothetical protein